MIVGSFYIPFERFYQKIENQHLHKEKQKVHSVNLLLFVSSSKSELQKLVKKVREEHSSKIPFLLCNIHKREQLSFFEKKRLRTHEVRAKDKGKLERGIESKRARIAVGEEQKIDNRQKYHHLHKCEDAKKVAKREYLMVKLRHKKHPKSQNNPAQTIDGRLKRSVKRKDTPNRNPQKKGV